MPTAAKTTETMSKHLTKNERSLRQRAEADVMPDRGRRAKLKKPAFIAKNKTANGYWNQIVKRMANLVILDDLDSEMLAGYCAMLARRDQTIQLIDQLMERLGIRREAETSPARRIKTPLSDAEWESSAREEAAPTPEEIIEAAGKLDALNGKLQALERNLLSYADKLGLTPSGRARLAQKRAEQAAKTEPDGDLFGD